MTEQDHVKLAKAALAAINAHDIDGYLKNIDDSFVAESEALGKVHGRDGARQMVTTLLQAFPDLHIEAAQILVSGNHVVTTAMVTGTHKGTFAGVPATNKKVHWHSCNVIEIKNGKAISSRIYADNVSLMRQLGVLPVPKAAAG
jgi:steroid delta-isomerase-like uncharacterized protein